METLFLDASQYTTAAELHSALQRLLQLPDYYGGNADALYDCLSERVQPVNLYLYSAGSGEVADAVTKVCRVMEDLGGTVTQPQA